MTDSTTPDPADLSPMGNGHSFGEWLDRHRHALLDRIRVMMGPQARRVADSDDFLQGVVAEVLASQDRLRVNDEAHFVRLVARIARNRIRDGVRKKRERRFESLSQSGVWLSKATRQSGPASQAQVAEAQEALADELLALDPLDREVLELRSLEGLPFDEVARRMDRTEAATRRLHSRALLRLGQRMRGRMESRD